MPIDTVQWRVRIGLFHSEGTYREMKRRRGCKHQKIKIESLIGDAPFIMAVALLAMELIRALIGIVLNDLWRRDSIGFFYTLYHTSWWYSGCQQQDGKPFRHKSVSRTGIPSLITALPSLSAVCLVALLSVVRMLLIMSGDVEQNPGPRITLSVGDLSTLTNILRDAAPKWIAIGDQLGFTDGELRSIRSIPQCITGGDQSCFRELLVQWLRQAPPNHELPTLENLASALREAREERLAYDLPQMYRDSTVTEDPMQSATNESFLEDHSASASRNFNQPKDEMTVSTEIKCFESRFEDLSFAACSEMEEKHGLLKRFRHSLTQLPVSIRREHLQFLRERLSDFVKAESIEELFMHLNLYWNFFDYALLEHIIEKFGSDRLKQQMASYVQDLAHFRCTTTLGQFIKVWPGREEELPPHFSELRMKLKKDIMEYTLEELEQLRREFCREYRLDPFVLRLANIKQSSIAILWHIPSVLTSKLTDAILDTHSSFFKHHEVVKLEVILHRQQKKEEMLEEGSEKQAQLLQQIQLIVQQRKEEKQEFQATLEQKESQLDWERAEKANLEQQLEASQITIQELRQTREYHKVQEDRERLLTAALRQKKDQIDSERSEKQHLQQQIKQLKAQLHSIQNEKEQSRMVHEQEPSKNKGQVELEKEMAHEQDQETQLPEWSHNLKRLELQLQDITISDREADAFAENLCVNQALEDLEFSSIKISDEGFSAIASSLHKNKSLKKINFYRTKISDSGASELASALQANQTLDKLELWEDTVSDEGFAAIAGGLKDNKSLKIVYVRRTKVSDIGANALASALKANQTLEHLVFWGITISDEGLSAVADTLRDNKGLKTLNFRRTNITDSGASALASALKVNQTLETLVLSLTKMSDSGTSALAGALRVNQTLERLEVDFESVSEEGAREFAAAVEANSSLMILEIWRPRLSKEVQGLLKETARRKKVHLTFSY